MEVIWVAWPWSPGLEVSISATTLLLVSILGGLGSKTAGKQEEFSSQTDSGGNAWLVTHSPHCHSAKIEANLAEKGPLTTLKG